MARLLERYRKEIVPAYMKLYNYTNIHQVPKLQKIVVNVGVGLKAQDNKVLESIQDGLGKITGQKPAIRLAKKAISGFKLKKNSPCGIVVTLRRTMMYEFLDRLISISIPRIRDFQGLSDKSFDAAGNYSFGITEQAIFPEIDMDKVLATHGMDIIIVTNAGSAKKAYDLLKLFGFPFKKPSK
ncbi:MAG: 50S ribosomal protein L5 [Candidatus Omnitrophica bacterium]|nr:50S ribosomal protein L5 [Candidatus Omnitrophota bacterium]